MDQKRLLAAVAISIGILLVFQYLNPSAHNSQQRQTQVAQNAEQHGQQPPTPGPRGPLGAATDASPATGAPQTEAQRLPVEGPRVQGSFSLRGAMLDDLVLRGYHETVDPNSALVRLFAPRNNAAPYFAQWGWTAADGHTRVPDENTDWSVQGSQGQGSGPLTPQHPVTLNWDNGQGQVFQLTLHLDDNYMVTADQSVRNNGEQPVQVLPWARVRRERTPPTQGYYLLHEGFVGVLGDRLNEQTYKTVRSETEKHPNTPALSEASAGGWAGFTDKYWLAALMPENQGTTLQAAYRFVPVGTGADNERWQVDFAPPQAQTVAPGADAQLGTRLFAGAKEVHLLTRYRDDLHIPSFDKAIDFGWFYFLTKPFFYAIDWLFQLFGNFGIAILVFTLLVKLAFFPLANKAYRSMGKMKLLGPKMQEIRTRYKDDPAKAQSEMMALYRLEKVNPASGCLPIVIQMPVFFSLYKVLFVTIEMRHAPFFGWIHDLSAPDPTNLFTAFGLIPWDPPHMLHMPIWAILMGITMFLQQKLNPAPPDPVQARMFQFMPLIFTFMLASFPAGLVIYWSWNNLLTIAQQYVIMRRAGVKPGQGAAVPAAGKVLPAAKPNRG